MLPGNASAPSPHRTDAPTSEGSATDRVLGALAPGTLPCQNSNNCTETGTASRSEQLQPSAKRTAAALAWNVAHLVQKFGIERVGFLTLTFAQNITSPKEAQKRWHSLRSHVLSKRYPAFMRVFERQGSGRIHYHALVVLPEGVDIRRGVDWERFAQGDYKTASPQLRREWAFWRKTAPAFGFGRTELLPVRSTGSAIASYVGKYIGKHLEQRQRGDKGVRLVEYSRGWKQASVRFAWVSPGAWLWRAKVKAFAEADGAATSGHLQRRFGKHWAFTFREVIMAIPLEFYPTLAHARADGRGADLHGVPEDATSIRLTRNVDKSSPLHTQQGNACGGVGGESNAGGTMRPLCAGDGLTTCRAAGDSLTVPLEDHSPLSRLAVGTEDLTDIDLTDIEFDEELTGNSYLTELLVKSRLIPNGIGTSPKRACIGATSRTVPPTEE